MKKLLKKWSIFLLVGVLSTGIVGCSKGEKTDAPPAKIEGENESSGEETELSHQTISIGYWDASDQFGDDDAILDIISEKFNVSFEGRGVSWSDYLEKYKLWAASDELPDIFATDELNTQTYNAWIEQGVVRALPDDLSDYPNIKAIMNQADVQPLKKDGSFYMVPRLTYPTTDMWRADRGLILRKDWLDELGLEIPETYDDYVAALQAMVSADFDGNGVDDTIGLTHKSKDMLGVLFNGSVPQVDSGSWIQEDGQWIPAFYSKNMVDGVEQLKNLYDLKLLDQDFGIMQVEDGMEKFAQGNVAMIAQQVNPSALRSLQDKWNKFGHDLKFDEAVIFLPPWSHPDGNRYTFTQTTYWSESYFNANMDDEKFERVMMLYDYLLSDEFKHLKTYGIEGVDYVKDGDDYEILIEQDENGIYKQIVEIYPSMKVLSQLGAWHQEIEFEDNAINTAMYGEGLIARENEFLDYCAEKTITTPINFDIKQMSTPAKDGLSAIRFVDDVIKVVLSGGDAETEWAKVRKDYEAHNVQDAIDEVNAKAAELGIE